MAEHGMPRRFVVYGAGAVGSLIGALLHRAGHDVTLIARGQQLSALQKNGLHLNTPTGPTLVKPRVVDGPAAVRWHGDDSVVLAVKSQDTATVLDALATTAPPTVMVVCAQNGVENERAALRRFADVLGMCVSGRITFLEPGKVTVAAADPAAITDLGRYPTGSDDRVRTLAAVLSAAGFAAEPRADIMAWKYAKLLVNLVNAVEALCGPGARSGEFATIVRREGEACLRAAGVGCVTAEDFRRRMAVLSSRSAAGPQMPAGSSSWQSMVRRTGSTEADYLNGEIVLLSRTYGVPAPANAVVQRFAARAAQARAEPGAIREQELLQALAAGR